MSKMNSLWRNLKLLFTDDFGGRRLATASAREIADRSNKWRLEWLSSRLLNVR
jgi:hypothetical protein